MADVSIDRVANAIQRMSIALDTGLEANAIALKEVEASLLEVAVAKDSCPCQVTHCDHPSTTTVTVGTVPPIEIMVCDRHVFLEDEL